MQQLNRLFLVMFFVSNGLQVKAQRYDTVSVFNIPIQISEVVISSAWNTAAFIQRVKEDTSFYKAFRSMHLQGYVSENIIKVVDSKGALKASYFCRSRQYRRQACRLMKQLQVQHSGDFFDRKGKYNYYTAQLYDYLFFTHDSVCGENDIVAGMLKEHGTGKMEKSKYELKQLIFNPGCKVDGVPLMGEKACIFNEKELHKYTFKIYAEKLDSIDCIVLSIKPKQEYAKEVVYNELLTWFRKSDKSIVARNYSLSFNTLIYDFDVKMKVRLAEMHGKLLPVFISYNGNWHVLGKKREFVQFDNTIYYDN
jgi:hypothetical protein